MTKNCYVVCRNSYGNTYPIRVFLTKEAANKYAKDQASLDASARYYVDTTTLEEV